MTLKTLGDESATVHTTQHHRFWSETRDEWVDAAALEPGESLRTEDGSVVTVRQVDNFTLHRVMHDLTVAEIHSYYVLAGTTPVLVHNCPAAAKALNAAEEATLGRMNELFPSEGLRGVNAPDADFVGQSGKFDAMGAPGAFKNWERQRGNFMAQIPRHAHKSDFGIVDMTGASGSQIDEVMTYYGTLDRNTQLRLIILDGTNILN